MKALAVVAGRWFRFKWREIQTFRQFALKCMTTVKLGKVPFLSAVFIRTWFIPSYRVTEELELNSNPHAVTRKTEKKSFPRFRTSGNEVMSADLILWNTLHVIVQKFNGALLLLLHIGCWEGGRVYCNAVRSALYVNLDCKEEWKASLVSWRKTILYVVRIRE